MIERLVAAVLIAYLLGGLATWLFARRKPAQAARNIYGKFAVYLAISLAMLASVWLRYPYVMLALLIVLAGGYEIYSRRKTSRSHLAAAITLYLVVASGFMGFSVCCSTALILTTYAAVLAMDGFSQVAGQMLGRIRLAPAISPNKTVEGLCGGLLCSGLGYAWLQGPNLDATRFAIFILVMLFALAGDLLASLYKRQVGIKDFSRLIPFHGGVLDRFDSFLMASFASFVLYGFGLTI